MKYGVIIALAIFWIVMAYRQFERGDMVLGGVFVLAGIALTVYRLQKIRVEYVCLSRRSQRLLAIVVPLSRA